MNGLTAELLPDGKAQLTFATTPGHVSVLIIDTARLEQLIQRLGELRAAMAPEVSPDFPMGQTVDAIPDPRWSSESELTQGNSLLHIRDNRYGWLHYVLPRLEARKLGGILIAQADSESPSGGAV
jgi:hypothetical protein